MQIWELNPGETFTAPVDHPRLQYEVVDFIINNRSGRIDSVLVNIIATRNGDSDHWTLTNGHHMTADPQAKVFRT